MMLSHLEAVFAADSVEELWALHTAKMETYGFDRLLYGFTRFKTANSFGDPQDLLVLSNHNPVYIEKFVNSGLYFHAPMVRWALENEGECSWSWMEKQAGAAGFSANEMKIIQFNMSMNVTAGYSISFKTHSPRSKGAIALTAVAGVSQAEVDQIWSEHGREIAIMNHVAHLKITSMPFSGSRQSLTARQREALEWVGEGKTTQDIATIMGLTAATVEKHLRLARQTLDVESTAQAVLKASFNNQIFLIEH